ncbi:hydantoinase [Nitratireductor aestuarii]|uniref:Hydantoinase n=1 Tax=Nitratireductor aestuarii TaxID=1735103 RepID=A0A916W9X6_9HYPH|nr:hydantoinase B/oxoprolinase family protein [Nitratireductor aestuarii]GGA81023.1 hydantoinase [Nitratireductor aestuarii]
MNTQRTIDAVDLSIMWNRLISITDEGAAALVRTSFSTLVREGYDLTVLIFDAAGRMIAQSAKCIPVFIGTAPTTLSHMLRKYPADTLVPGDVVISNDPMYGTGHMFDLAVMRPIFDNELLVGFSMGITHLPDIGGMGFSVSATEIYHEGLRLPICKLYKAGMLDHDVIELIELNVRVPEQVTGDIFASVSCTEVVARHVLEFMREYQLDSLTELADAILTSTDDAVRSALRAMPDGVFRNEVQVEALGEVRKLVCAINKTGDTIEVDFEGTGPCVGAGINVPFPYTRAMVLYAIKCLTSPNIPNNEGAMRAIEVKAPLGSILNAIPPSPSAGRHAIGHFIFPLITDTLAEIVPDRVAASSGLLDIVTLQGFRRDGSPMAATYFCAGGFGGAEGLDGHPTLPGSSNMGRTPIEVFEPLTGLTVLEKSLRPDSGGPGRYPGGAGQTIVMRNDTGYPMRVYAMANRTLFPADGVFEGKAGAVREHWVDGEKMSGQGAYTLAPGQHLKLLQPGGGGFGDPALRTSAQIEQDIERGFLTPEGAKSLYSHAG